MTFEVFSFPACDLIAERPTRDAAIAVVAALCAGDSGLAAEYGIQGLDDEGEVRVEIAGDDLLRELRLHDQRSLA